MKEQEIINNWNQFYDFAISATGDRSESIKNLLDEMGERIAAAPATPKHEAGTLVDFNLKVMKKFSILNKKFDLGISDESMVICCFFRNLGMVGDLENDLLIPQESKWHRENRGELFKYNNDVPYMKPFDRAIYLLNHFGVRLTQDEYMAILGASGNNEHYKYGETPLAFAVYAAVRFVGFENDKEKET